MIKFLDLHKINLRFHDEFETVFRKFLDSGCYILGDQVKKFEMGFSTFCGAKYCVGVSNGLDALRLIFEAYKVLGKLKKGDEVIVPANTYIATVLSVSNSGFKPILVEPNIETYNIDPIQIERAITSKTKAILGVHLYGNLYDVDRLEKIAKDNNLLLIEDASQAHGAVYDDNRKAGNVSNAAAFSFYPTKNLGALGDGGAVITNDEELDKVLRRLRSYGRISSYVNSIKGYNCRLDEVQAALLRVKLKHLDSDNEIRRDIAQLYCESINNRRVILPVCKVSKRHVFHQFVIRHKERDKLRAYLANNGIETLIHYPIPVHKQKAYKEFNYLLLSVTEKIHDEVLSLPISPIMEIKEVQKVINVLSKFH